MGKHTKDELQYLQGLPLKMKIALTKDRIRDWVNEYGTDGVYCSFSGGKDSTVLLHIVRQMYPSVNACFSNTGLEFPEIVKFVKTFSNVDIVRPKMPYVEVIKKYGYPMISKEVSECVFGARKYLTAVIAENSIAQTDRQTDRQTDAPYGYFYKKLCGFGEYEKSNRGGYENKYRRLRGIGNYASVDARDWSKDEKCWRYFNKLVYGEQVSLGDVEKYGIDSFGRVCFPEKNATKRSKTSNRQFASTTSDGNQSDGRESNDGEYP